LDLKKPRARRVGDAVYLSLGAEKGGILPEPAGGSTGINEGAAERAQRRVNVLSKWSPGRKKKKPVSSKP